MSNVFRTCDRLHEVMIRAVMPRTSAGDPAVIVNRPTDRPDRVWHDGRLMTGSTVRPLTVTLADRIVTR